MVHLTLHFYPFPNFAMAYKIEFNSKQAATAIATQAAPPHPAAQPLRDSS